MIKQITPALLIILFFYLHHLEAATTLFGPKRYSGQGSGNTVKKYTETISLSTSDLNSKFTIKISNADGADHPILTCNQTNVLARIRCRIANLINTLYIDNIRVQSFELRNNGVNLISSNQVNKNVATFTATLPLVAVNNLEILVTGRATSYLMLEILKENAPLDTTPPLINYSLNSDALTNNSSSTVTISDSSDVSTQVYINGNLVQNTTSKVFIVTLFEGVNDLIIKSVDIYGNHSLDLMINRITLDTNPPIITSDISSQYFASALPFTKLVTFTSNEELSLFQIDNAGLIQTGINTYSYLLEISDLNSKIISINAIDKANNEINLTFSTQVFIDDTAPTISTNQVPRIIGVDHFQLEIVVADSSNTSTIIYIDGLLAVNTADKNITYQIQFPVDQTKQVKIVSTDVVGNSNSKLFDITRDTRPLFVNIISPQNRSVVTSQIIEVRATANKPLSSAKVNGQPASISSDQISVKADLAQMIDGDMDITVEVIDIYGTQAVQSLKVSVKLNELSSWAYEECPTNEL